MARPRHDQPTPAELEILKVIWDRGPSTVRQVMEILNKPGARRAYTSVMSLMNVMAEKRLLKRKPHGRAYLYQARVSREQTASEIVDDVVNRVFEGSTSTMVAHLLARANPSEDELKAIRRLVRQKRPRGKD